MGLCKRLGEKQEWVEPGNTSPGSCGKGQGGWVAVAKYQKALFHLLVRSVRENLGSGNIFYFNIFF